MERSKSNDKGRVDLINDIKRAAFILGSSADFMRGEDDSTVSAEQYVRLQEAYGAMGLAVTALRLQVSPHVKKPQQADTATVVPMEVSQFQHDDVTDSPQDEQLSA